MRFTDIPAGPLHYCDDCMFGTDAGNCLAGGNPNRNGMGTCNHWRDQPAEPPYKPIGTLPPSFAWSCGHPDY